MYSCLGHNIGVQAVAEVDGVDVITKQMRVLAYALGRGQIAVCLGCKESTGALHTTLDRYT